MSKTKTGKKTPMYAILAAGLCGDFGRCVLVNEKVFNVARACIDDESETWNDLSKSTLKEFKTAFDKTNENRTYDFEEEMQHVFGGYQSLYLFICNSTYYGVSLSFGQRFSDLGELANYVSENNIHVVETTHDD